MTNDSPVNILLVDDQPGKLLSYEVILEGLGETLIKASSGREALEQLLRNEIAVVLVDVSMPDLDGFELVAMIREHPRFERTAIIFVSAIHMSDVDRLRGYRAGAVDYLPVPVVPDLLRAKVRVFADLYRKTRQLEMLNAELEQRVAERTSELERANADLERRVEERTREREAALAKIAEMQKLESLGQLTGGLAHDFNNLLMVVLSNLEFARTHANADRRVAKWLDRAAEAAERGASLTKQMLAFARRQDLQPQSVDLQKVVDSMTEMMRHTLDPTVRIHQALEAGLPMIRIDRNQLELALLNLGLNARDAMPTGGVLSIEARHADNSDRPDALMAGSYVKLSVGDTGIGMGAETLNRASEPFFTTKGAGKGSGLGLSMVHGLAIQSGGTMRIASRLGEGTIVSLWLPVALETIEPETQAASPQTPLSQKCRVLVVDDDPLVLMTTAEMISDLGHEVIEASSAKHALEVLQQGALVDLVITDHAMPEMTGAHLAHKIRELWPGVPVLLATGYADGALVASLDLPRLDKPYSRTDLEQHVSMLMRSRQAPYSRRYDEQADRAI
jgi:signal transduction histidine kinase